MYRCGLLYDERMMAASSLVGIFPSFYNESWLVKLPPS
jgi:hypothetical protein